MSIQCTSCDLYTTYSQRFLLHVSHRQHRGCRWTVSGHWRTWYWGTSIPTKVWLLLCSFPFPVIQTLGMRAQVSRKLWSVINALRSAASILRYIEAHIVKDSLLLSQCFMFCACADDEKLCPVAASINTVAFTGNPAKPAPHVLFLNKLQELNTPKYDYVA